MGTLYSPNSRGRKSACVPQSHSIHNFSFLASGLMHYHGRRNNAWFGTRLKTNVGVTNIADKLCEAAHRELAC